MKDTIRQALRDLKNTFGELVFSNARMFRSALADVLPGTSNELARNLLNNAIGGMNVYGRLSNSASGNMGVDVYNMTKEMSRNYGTNEDMARTVMECIAEMLGYTSPTASGQPQTAAPPAPQTPIHQPPSQPISQPISQPLSPSIYSLTDGGIIHLQFGEWKEAAERFNEVIKIDPRHAPAYIGKLCAEIKLKKEDELASHDTPLTDYVNFQKATSFADPAYRQTLERYSKAVLSHIAEAGRRVQVGSIYQFGSMDGRILDWRVLDIQSGKALLLSKDILERRPYHSTKTSITWEDCTLRREYLNGEFLNKFSQADRSRIIETRTSNPPNTCYNTPGCDDTTDKIFLLSLEEVDRYFGDSEDYINKRRKSQIDGKWVEDSNGHGFSNTNDSERIATYNGSASWWWLRSPGYNSNLAAIVYDVGIVDAFGSPVSNDNSGGGGVRPAMWLNL